MSAIRYSGTIRIRITYLEPYLAGDKCPAGRSTRLNGEYRCFLRADGYTATIIVGAPAVLSHAVDSPEAFDDAARAAIAFADDEARHGRHSLTWGDIAAVDDDGTGYLIARNPLARLLKMPAAV